MAFYDEFNRYYDAIFPVKKNKLLFLKESFSPLPEGAAVLDLGCGTGGYTLALKSAGFRPVGIDLEMGMLDQAREKARELDRDVDFKLLDMRDLDTFYSRPHFRGVFSFGNVLVHLTRKEEIADLCQQLGHITLREGVLIIQIVNYDRILADEVTELPTLINEKEGVKFIRNYEHREDGLIDFKSQLIISDNEQDRVYENTIPLYPLRSDELLDMLTDANFHEIEKFGDFTGSPFQPDSSFPLIVRAKKRKE